MKKYYIGIPVIILAAFSFHYVNWSKENSRILLAQQQAEAERAAAEAEEKRIYQERMKEKALAEAAKRAREKAEKNARDEAEEKAWVALNKELDEAVKKREELADQVYETTNHLYLEEERLSRIEESYRRKKEEKRFLTQYIPEVQANRQSLERLLARAGQLATIRSRSTEETPKESARR